MPVTGVCLCSKAISDYGAMTTHLSASPPAALLVLSRRHTAVSGQQRVGIRPISLRQRTCHASHDAGP